MNVNSGIVPIRVEATLLSTYISLKLIKLNGKTLPNIAMQIRRILFLLNLNFTISFLQKTNKTKVAINSL